MTFKRNDRVLIAERYEGIVKNTIDGGYQISVSVGYGKPKFWVIVPEHWVFKDEIR